MASESGAAVNRANDSSPPAAPPRRGLIEKWLEYTENYTSPRIFRLWTILSIIGMAVKRNVWTEVGDNVIYPNLFVFLVGPPGTGKTQAMKPAIEILQRSDAVALLPSDASKQSLLDALKAASGGARFRRNNGEWELTEWHYGALLVSELSAFMSDYDKQIAGLLTDLFDCLPLYKEDKRTSKAVGEIVNPGLGVLIGTATKNLGATVHGDLWGSGFSARIILVYSADKVRPANMWAKATDKTSIKAELVKDFGMFKDEIAGPMQWSEDAKDDLWSWRVDNEEAVPLHNKLTDYTTRRWFHLAKLCMVSALSRQTMTVDRSDFERAVGWLLEAEQAMPEVFKDMVNHSDGEVYDELRSWLRAAHMKCNGPIPHKVLVGFFTSRTATHNIERMIKIAESADFIRRVAGTDGDESEWLPGDPNARWV